MDEPSNIFKSVLLKNRYCKLIRGSAFRPVCIMLYAFLLPYWYVVRIYLSEQTLLLHLRIHIRQPKLILGRWIHPFAILRGRDQRESKNQINSDAQQAKLKIKESNVIDKNCEYK